LDGLENLALNDKTLKDQIQNLTTDNKFKEKGFEKIKAVLFTQKYDFYYFFIWEGEKDIYIHTGVVLF